MSLLSKAILIGASQAIAGPVYLLALATGAKSFEANPIIGSRRFNEAGLHAARVSLAHRMANRRRNRLSHLISTTDRLAFERDGFILRENFLPSPTFANLIAQVKSHRTKMREVLQGDTINRKIAVTGTTLRAIPALREVLSSPEWRGWVSYVGSHLVDPTVFIETIIRNSQDGPVDPQTLLHADTFHPTVKAWLFLTDVAQDGGPFTYVPGSHRLTEERLQWERKMSLAARCSADKETREGSFRIDVAELGSLNLPAPLAFAVPANTLVVADTFGFHARGPSLGPSMRVEVWALGRRRPFVPWTKPDPWTTTTLGLRTALVWKFGSLLERSASRRIRTAVSAFDPQ